MKRIAVTDGSNGSGDGGVWVFGRDTEVMP